MGNIISLWESEPETASGDAGMKTFPVTDRPGANHAATTHEDEFAQASEKQWMGHSPEAPEQPINSLTEMASLEAMAKFEASQVCHGQYVEEALQALLESVQGRAASLAIELAACDDFQEDGPADATGCLQAGLLSHAQTVAVNNLAGEILLDNVSVPVCVATLRQMVAPKVSNLLGIRVRRSPQLLLGERILQDSEVLGQDIQLPGGPVLVTMVLPAATTDSDFALTLQCEHDAILWKWYRGEEHTFGVPRSRLGQQAHDTLLRKFPWRGPRARLGS